MNDGGLIVERLDMHAGGECGANLLDLGVNFVSDVERVAVRLTMDAEQDGGFPIGGHHGVDRRDRRRDVGDITETNGNTSGGSLHDNLAELLRRSNLPADQTENQLMIIFDETGRVDQIGPADGLENIVDGDAGSEQARRLRHDLELRNAAALNENGSDAIEPVYARLEIVGGNLPQLALRNRVGGQAIAEDRERGEGQAVSFDLGCRRQFRLQAGDDGVDALQRQDHVARPVEEKIDLRRAAAGDGLNFLQAGNTVDGFFDGTRDDYQHLVDGHHTVVNANDDARKVGVWENRNRNGEREVPANEHQNDD